MEIDGRKLKRITNYHKWIGGICAGTAYWLKMPLWLVRIVWSAATLAWGFGFILYILLWIFMPKWPKTPENFSSVTN